MTLAGRAQRGAASLRTAVHPLKGVLSGLLEATRSLAESASVLANRYMPVWASKTQEDAPPSNNYDQGGEFSGFGP